MKPDLVRHPGRRTWVWVTAALLSAGTACGVPSANTPPPAIVEPTVRPTAAAPAPTSQPTAGSDLIFHNGVLLTMDESQPAASAIHIQGERIVSVGDESSILAEAGPQTRVVDLGGRTLMPGFVDAHSHMFAEPDPAQLQATLLQTGVTTTAEMYVDEPLLQRLLELEAGGGLRVRLSAYLLYTNGCGEPLGEWWRAYPPTRRPGEMLRIGGIKLFTDGGSCGAPAVTFEYANGVGTGDLYFTQPELEAALRTIDGAGYQAAVHALGDRALDVALGAFENLWGGVNPRRHRIEHNGVLRPDQLARYSAAQPVATISAPFATCHKLGAATRFKYEVPDEYRTWEWPWRDLINANPGLHLAWHGDMPHVFPPDVAYQLFAMVTRAEVAEDGSICQPPDWIAHNALTVDEALQLMTTGAAYALQRDAEVGSLTVGKYADLIVLSDNPRAIPSTELKDLKVLMTMVGGNVEYCAEGMEAVCPTAAGSEPTTEMTAAAPLASSVFRDDFEGALDPGWSWYQNDAPGWTLSNMPGWLRLNLSTGSFFSATPPANLLLRPAPSGDFELETWLRFSPYRNFEIAGLVVVFDDHSVVQFGRGFCEVPGSAECVGDGLYFDNIQGGSPVGGNFPAPSLLGVDYLLRLQRQGHGYSASYSTDGSNWVSLGSHTVDKAPMSIGLIAAQAESAGNYADFDYFEITAP
jgi:predicted amidohydrolase YtcJ